MHKTNSAELTVSYPDNILWVITHEGHACSMHCFHEVIPPKHSPAGSFPGGELGDAQTQQQ